VLKIGLTGGIGSGKTYVCNVFRALQVPVYDADNSAKKLMKNDSELANGIINLLGEDAYSDNSLNKDFIAQKIFSDDETRVRLNKLVHPVVGRDFELWTKGFEETTKYLLEEAALLFESGAAGKMNYNIFIKADKDTRLKRIMDRDGFDEKTALVRMKSQIDPDIKEKYADFVINNNEGVRLLIQIVDLHHKLTELKN